MNDNVLSFCTLVSQHLTFSEEVVSLCSFFHLLSGCFQAFAELHGHPGPGHHSTQLQDVFRRAPVFLREPGVSPGGHRGL